MHIAHPHSIQLHYFKRTWNRSRFSFSHTNNNKWMNKPITRMPFRTTYKNATENFHTQINQTNLFSVLYAIRGMHFVEARQKFKRLKFFWHFTNKTWYDINRGSMVPSIAFCAKEHLKFEFFSEFSILCPHSENPAIPKKWLRLHTISHANKEFICVCAT